MRTTKQWYDDDVSTAPISEAIEKLPAVEGLRIAK